MPYHTEVHEEIYTMWCEQLALIPQGKMVQETAHIMRSKLTSLIGCAQLLLEDDDDDTDEETLALAHMILQSAQTIAVLLDAAVDAETAKQTPQQEKLLHMLEDLEQKSPRMVG